MADPYPGPLEFDPDTREFTTPDGHAIGCLYEPDDQAGGSRADADTAAIEQQVAATGEQMCRAYSRFCEGQIAPGWYRANGFVPEATSKGRAHQLDGDCDMSLVVEFDGSCGVKHRTSGDYVPLPTVVRCVEDVGKLCAALGLPLGAA